MPNFTPKQKQILWELIIVKLDQTPIKNPPLSLERELKKICEKLTPTS